MNTFAPSAAAADAARHDPREGRAERQLRLLEELADVGMRLVRSLDRQVAAQAAQAETGEPAVAPLWGGGDVALVFSRLARAVRQTLALEAKLDEDRRAREDGREVKRAEERAQAVREQQRQQKLVVKRIVERGIESVAATDYHADDLQDQLAERLEDGKDWDFADWPLAAIVGRICRDIGMAFDPSLWEEEADDASEEAGAEAEPPDESAGADRRAPPRDAASGLDPPPVSGRA